MHTHTHTCAYYRRALWSNDNISYIDNTYHIQYKIHAYTCAYYRGALRLNDNLLYIDNTYNIHKIKKI